MSGDEQISTESSGAGRTMPRALQWVAAVRAWSTAPSRRRIVYAVALALFLVSTFVAWRSLPATDESLDFALVAVAAFLVLPGSLVNAEEYRLSAAVVGQSVPVGQALRVSVIAAAFNLLPVPGSVLVRTNALTKGGSTTGRAVASTAATGLAYIGAALVLVAGVQVRQGDIGAGVITAVGGAGSAFIVGAWLMVGRLSPEGMHRHVARLVVVEFLSVTIKAVRLLVVIQALGFELDLSQAASLSVATVTASAIGVFPGGLGVRELLAGVISPAIGLPASVGLVGVAFDRVIGLTTLSMVAVFVLWFTRDRSVPEPEVIR